jgi:hypothetical protein
MEKEKVRSFMGGGEEDNPKWHYQLAKQITNEIC